MTTVYHSKHPNITGSTLQAGVHDLLQDAKKMTPFSTYKAASTAALTLSEAYFDRVLFLDASGFAFTVNLPNPNVSAGRKMKFIVTDATSVITITSPVASTLNVDVNLATSESNTTLSDSIKVLTAQTSYALVALAGGRAHLDLFSNGKMWYISGTQSVLSP